MNDKVYRVTPGGLFHTPKVKYSPETEKLIRDLIRESKLSIFQRKKVEESVKNGEALPLPPSKTARGISQDKSKLKETTKKEIPRRRKRQDILLSGAYEREAYAPSYLKANHDIEKAKLQEVMAFGRTLKSGRQHKPPQSLQFSSDDCTLDDKSSLLKKTALDHLADEIEDRKNFLAKLESIGRGKGYREIINQEIQEKLLLAGNIFQKMDKIKSNPQTK